MADGALHLPGVFEEPRLPLTHLSGELRWQIDGEQLTVQAPEMRLSMPTPKARPRPAGTAAAKRAFRECSR